MGILIETPYLLSDWNQISELQVCYGCSSNSPSGKVPSTASSLSFSMTLTWIRDSEDVLQVFPPIIIVLKVVLNTADSQGTNYFVCVFHARNSQLFRLYVSQHVILQLTAQIHLKKKLQTTAEINTIIKVSKYFSYYVQKNTSSGGISRLFDRGTFSLLLT